MDNSSPILRFGITTNGKRSSYWRLRAGVDKPELFLEREAPGKKVHLSLHASGHWHLKVGRKERESWIRPLEIVPVYTRAAGIVRPVAVARHEDPAPDGVVLVPVAPDADPTTFSVFIERPGADQHSWPGKDADRSTFVGRIPLADGAGTCVVAAVQAPLQPGRMEMPRPSNEELRQIREWAINGVLVSTIVGGLSDGAIALIDVCADTTVATTIAAALGG